MTESGSPGVGNQPSLLKGNHQLHGFLGVIPTHSLLGTNKTRHSAVFMDADLVGSLPTALKGWFTSILFVLA